MIGRGGMGEVYEVEDRHLQGVRVALKTLLPRIAADADAQRSLEHEVLLARSVTHPNLCPIYDIARGESQGQSLLFLTMSALSVTATDKAPPVGKGGRRRNRPCQVKLPPFTFRL